VGPELPPLPVPPPPPLPVPPPPPPLVPPLPVPPPLPEPVPPPAFPPLGLLFPRFVPGFELFELPSPQLQMKSASTTKTNKRQITDTDTDLHTGPIPLADCLEAAALRTGCSTQWGKNLGCFRWTSKPRNRELHPAGPEGARARPSRRFEVAGRGEQTRPAAGAPSSPFAGRAT